MKAKDFTKLKKIMQRTVSENDNEALTSIRMANKIIEESGVTWERVFNHLVTVDIESVDAESAVPKQAQAEKRERDTAVDEKFKKLLDALPEGRFRTFILDLNDQWEKSGYLSQNQRDALFNAKVGGSR